jgi:C4-dicarboxylate transporter
MNKYFELANNFFKGMTGLFTTLLSFAVMAEILFGNSVLGMGVIDNIMGLINMLGNSGIIGLITLVILFNFLGDNKG